MCVCNCLGFSKPYMQTLAQHHTSTDSQQQQTTTICKQTLSQVEVLLAFLSTPFTNLI